MILILCEMQFLNGTCMVYVRDTVIHRKVGGMIFKVNVILLNCGDIKDPIKSCINRPIHNFHKS